MPNIFYSAEANPAVVADDLITEEVRTRMVDKNGGFMDIPNGCHRCEAVCELKVEGSYSGTEEQLRMEQAMGVMQIK